MNPSKAGLYIDDGKTVVRVEDQPAEVSTEVSTEAPTPSATPTEELD